MWQRAPTTRRCPRIRRPWHRARGARGVPRPGGPQTLLRARAAHRLGQRAVVAHGEMQSEHIVMHPLGHAADIGADHGAAKHERLRNHQPETLPPQAGHDAPVHPRHPRGQLGHLIGTAVRHDAVLHRPCRLLGQKGLDLVAHRLAGIAQIVAVQIDGERGEALRAEQRGRRGAGSTGRPCCRRYWPKKPNRVLAVALAGGSVEHRPHNRR